MDSEPWTWPIFATVAPGNNSYYSTLVAFYLPVAYNLMSSHVIIGGLGNVGRHMQHLLLRKGKVVRVLDRARPASATAERGLVHPSVEFRPFQLGYDDPVKLRDELKGAEVVYSMVTPDVQHGTVYDFEQTNHLGVQHLIDACRDAGVPKLVYASSIAATNHFIESRNKNEQDPLPPWETYKTLYDRTKRLGEEVVLNAGSEGDGNFKACAIRLGGILAGPTDYYTRHYWEMGEKNGRLISAKGSRIDSISAKDLVRALWKAQEKLDDSETSDLVSGRAFFVTKSSNKVTPETHEIGAHLAKLMDWEIQFLPGPVYAGIMNGLRFAHTAKSLFQGDSYDDALKQVIPGTPPHLYMEIPLYEQTFDNSLAKEVLGFEARESWEEAVEWIVDEYRESRR